ncbi:MAG: hypothetical protein AAF597_09840 [Bacteroidota bacterium]
MTDEKKENSGLAQWLDSIQQESWQLELLISGFSIFLLLGGWGWLEDLEYDFILLVQGNDGYDLLGPIYYGGRVAYGTLTGCLLLHVMLRGLWIAAVGLRSVSGGIEYDKLRYSTYFRDRLHRRMGTFDQYIEGLEKYCSVFFSVAFLIFFCFLSIVSCLMTFTLIQTTWLSFFGLKVQDVDFLETGVLGFIFLFICLLYLVDFVSLGLLKRTRWLSKPYYFLYRFMGWVTLARFYRPLYHNLIDDRFGRKLVILLPIIVVGIIVLSSIQPVSYTYHPGNLGNGEEWVYKEYYDDEATGTKNRAWRMSLTSRFARNNYVEVFVPYVPVNDDELLALIDSSMEVAQYTGIILEGGINAGNNINRDADNAALLKAFNGMYNLFLNDSLLNVSPRFYRHTTRKQPGLLYSIPVHELAVGEHQIRLDRRQYRYDTLAFNAGINVYFYK